MLTHGERETLTVLRTSKPEWFPQEVKSMICWSYQYRFPREQPLRSVVGYLYNFSERATLTPYRLFVVLWRIFCDGGRDIKCLFWKILCLQSETLPLIWWVYPRYKWSLHGSTVTLYITYNRRFYRTVKWKCYQKADSLWKWKIWQVMNR